MAALIMAAGGNQYVDLPAKKGGLVNAERVWTPGKNSLACLRILP